ncbi:hypothetical protein GH714_037731 [Hevea brasiliensis]|uniref:CMP/dCMP-type deaminase domain-containing protein n=1 Tax=Hevea brasiliensis TaxID=3981 RepID=A0A6A6LWS6_HEVBR|nr:hypothetical protein GH714_037731 [Hevea brasiliensis]
MAKESGLAVLQLLPSLVKEARSLACTPISNYHVGVVGLGSSGRIFFGANIEFPGLPLHHTIHAEQFLITNLTLNAERGLNYMAVSAAPVATAVSFSKKFATPPISRSSSQTIVRIVIAVVWLIIMGTRRNSSPCPTFYRTGKVHRGSYMESAAYNPSLGPVQAALVAYVVGGGGDDYEKIVAAIGGERRGCSATGVRGKAAFADDFSQVRV